MCVLDNDRQVMERRKFPTTREAVHERFAGKTRKKIVLEAGSQSPWLSAALREYGHEVLVADPRKIALIAKGHRKTDRRDAEVLARLGLGMPELLGEVHHRSLEDQADMAVLRARDLCVSTRTRMVQHVRGTLKAFGIRMRSCSAASFHRLVLAEIPVTLMPAIKGVLECLQELEVRIREYDRLIVGIIRTRKPAARRLQEVNGVGPVTSLGFVLTISNPARFQKSRLVGSWTGLAPRVMASGDRDPALSISKAGDKYLRRLLAQAAHYILGPFGKDSDLRRFGLRLAAGGGKGAKRRSVIAVARKLSVLLHRLWVTDVPYAPLRNAQPDRSASNA
jgi:transposase